MSVCVFVCVCFGGWVWKKINKNTLIFFLLAYKKKAEGREFLRSASDDEKNKLNKPSNIKCANSLLPAPPKRKRRAKLHNARKSLEMRAIAVQTQQQTPPMMPLPPLPLPPPSVFH